MHLVLKVRREYPMLTKAKVGHDLTRGPPSTPMSRLQNTHTYTHNYYVLETDIITYIVCRL